MCSNKERGKAQDIKLIIMVAISKEAIMSNMVLEMIGIKAFMTISFLASFFYEKKWQKVMPQAKQCEM